MKIKQKEIYEDLAAEWQYQMIKLLKSALAKQKVDENKAKEICGDFAFDLAMLQDRGVIKHNKKNIVLLFVLKKIKNN